MGREPRSSAAAGALGRLDAVPAPALVLAAIVSVQTGSAVARSLFGELGAPGVTFLRLALAALVLLVLVRPRVRAWDRRQWGAAGLLGLAMGAMNLAFYLSIRQVPLGVAVTVEFLGPLLLALVQTRRSSDLAWSVLAAAGVALLGLHRGAGAPLGGLLLAFAAGSCWAGYILATARVGRLLPGLDGLAVACAVGAVLVAPFGLPGATGVVGSWHLLGAALAVALLSSVLSYGLEMTALRTLPTRVFGILMSLEPGAAALSGLLVLGQALHLREVVALLLVSAASAGTTLSRPDERVLQPLE